MTDPGHRIPGLSGGPPPQWAAPHRVPPPQPPAGPSRPIREHRLPATILLIVTTLALFAASAVVGRPDDGRSRSPVMAYLPPSGTRVVLQTSDGKDEVDEYYTTVGMAFSQSGPSALGYGIESVEEAQTTTWLRVFVTIADAAGTEAERQTQLYAVKPTGLELRVAAWPDRFLMFKPGLLMLPAGVQPGHTWSVAGTAGLGSGAAVTLESPMSASFSATAAGDGCVVVAGDLSVGSGTAAVRSRSSMTWCQGRGAVAGSDSTRTVTAVQRPPVWGSAFQPSERGPLPDPVAGGRLEGRDMTGLPPMALAAGLPPVVLPGRVLVYPNQLNGDLVARGWDDGMVDARWAAQPGGSITGLLAIDRIVVATTSERRVVAYGDQGQYLWQATLPDAAEADPVRFGRLVVVGGLDGTVSAYDAATGTLAWRTHTPNEIRQPPVVTDSGVTVLDQAGNLLTLAADGSTLASFSTEPPESFTVRDGLVVVAGRTDGVVRAYRLPDGSIAWRTPVLGARNSLTPVGGVIVVQQNDNLRALRTTDGTDAWSKSLRPTALAALGDSLVVSDVSSVYRLGADGSTLATWPTDATNLDESFTGLDVGTSDLFLLHNNQAYLWVAP
ncbi:MAG: PQQ-binding-like beta-propeller repeat protein [Micropruina glycogenica]